jgi:uncharacterized protein
MLFALLVLGVAVIVGAVASVAGFGIGSALTPLVATELDMKAAVAIVAIPHFAATVLRAWRLRHRIDRRVLVRFGIASATGGLLGALLHGRIGSSALGVVFGSLLVLAGLMGLTGLADRVRFGRRAAWIIGLLSSAFGGLVGQQGGIRSAGLLGFDVKKEAFVATATAIGVVVDLVRVPVYIATQGEAIARAWPIVASATAGALVGTVLGERILKRIPEKTFRRVVSAIILALGILIVAREA